MRVKDEVKQQAVIDATIKVVNDIGFASASISKIAKEAGVSVATIYVYHTNKEDLLVNVYYEVKRRLTLLYYQGMEESRSAKVQLKTFWTNVVKAGAKVPKLISYAEQFANAPFVDLVDEEVVAEFATPLLRVIDKAVNDKAIKKIEFDLFIALFVAPANYLGNRKVCSRFEASDKNINKAFDMIWLSIKR